jgi:hypothetical protein
MPNGKGQNEKGPVRFRVTGPFSLFGIERSAFAFWHLAFAICH